MKATELMIGDYVNVEYPGRTEIDKVKAIYQHSLWWNAQTRKYPRSVYLLSKSHAKC